MLCVRCFVEDQYSKADLATSRDSARTSAWSATRGLGMDLPVLCRSRENKMNIRCCCYTNIEFKIVQFKGKYLKLNPNKKKSNLNNGM